MSDGKFADGSSIKLLMTESPYQGEIQFNSERKEVPTVIGGSTSQIFMTPQKKENHSVRFHSSINNSDIKNYSSESNKRMKLQQSPSEYFMLSPFRVPGGGSFRNDSIEHSKDIVNNTFRTLFDEEPLLLHTRVWKDVSQPSVII